MKIEGWVSDEMLRALQGQDQKDDCYPLSIWWTQSENCCNPVTIEAPDPPPKREWEMWECDHGTKPCSDPVDEFCTSPERRALYCHPITVVLKGDCKCEKGEG